MCPLSAFDQSRKDQGPGGFHFQEAGVTAGCGQRAPGRLEQFNIGTTNAIWAPPATPRDVITRISAEFAAIILGDSAESEQEFQVRPGAQFLECGLARVDCLHDCGPSLPAGQQYKGIDCVGEGEAQGACLRVIRSRKRHASGDVDVSITIECRILSRSIQGNGTGAGRSHGRADFVDVRVSSHEFREDREIASACNY